MKFFADTNKCAMAYSICQYYNKLTINCVFFLAFTFFLCSALKYHKMTKKLYPPQFMFNAGGTFIIIFVFFYSNVCLKAFVNKYAKFWKNTLTCFWFMDFESNWWNPDQNVHKWPGSEGVNMNLLKKKQICR